MVALFTRHPLILGFVTGYAPPFVYGIYVIRHELAYFALHPGPQCGMGMLLAYTLILCVGPATGVIGAAVSCMFTKLYQKSIRQKY